MDASTPINEDEQPVQLPIEGELDLHTFRPADVKELVPAYLEECRKRGILEVRVVHGKGVGHLRRTVHSVLARLAWVESYSLATAPYGGWGATIVHLRPEGGETARLKAEPPTCGAPPAGGTQNQQQ